MIYTYIKFKHLKLVKIHVPMFLNIFGCYIKYMCQWSYNIIKIIFVSCHPLIIAGVFFLLIKMDV